MGNRNYRGTKDNCSNRDFRASRFDKTLMSMLPREPVRRLPTLARVVHFSWPRGNAKMAVPQQIRFIPSS